VQLQGLLVKESIQMNWEAMNVYGGLTPEEAKQRGIIVYEPQGIRLPADPPARAIGIGTAGGDIIANILTGFGESVMGMYRENPMAAYIFDNILDARLYNTHWPSLEVSLAFSAGKALGRGIYKGTTTEWSMGAENLKEAEESFTKEARAQMYKDCQGPGMLIFAGSIGDGNTSTALLVEAVKVGLEANPHAMIVVVVALSSPWLYGGETSARGKVVQAKLNELYKLPVKVVVLLNDELTRPESPWSTLQAGLGLNVLNLPLVWATPALLGIMLNRRRIDESKLRKRFADGRPGILSLVTCDMPSDRPPQEQIHRAMLFGFSSPMALSYEYEEPILYPPIPEGVTADERKALEKEQKKFPRIDSVYGGGLGSVSGAIAGEFCRQAFTHDMVVAQGDDLQRLNANLMPYAPEAFVFLFFAQSDKNYPNPRRIDLQRLDDAAVKLREAENALVGLQIGRQVGFRGDMAKEAAKAWEASGVFEKHEINEAIAAFRQALQLRGEAGEDIEPLQDAPRATEQLPARDNLPQLPPAAPGVSVLPKSQKAVESAKATAAEAPSGQSTDDSSDNGSPTGKSAKTRSGGRLSRLLEKISPGKGSSGAAQAEPAEELDDIPEAPLPESQPVTSSVKTEEEGSATNGGATSGGQTNGGNGYGQGVRFTRRVPASVPAAPDVTQISGEEFLQRYDTAKARARILNEPIGLEFLFQFKGREDGLLVIENLPQHDKDVAEGPQISLEYVGVFYSFLEKHHVYFPPVFRVGSVNVTTATSIKTLAELMKTSEGSDHQMLREFYQVKQGLGIGAVNRLTKLESEIKARS
jgi:hypothetical protein